MNKHAAADTIVVSSLRLIAGKNKYFVKNINSPSYREHLQSVRLSLPDFGREGSYELSAESLAGTLDPALLVAQWYGAACPTIIYHHGSHGNPFDSGPFSLNTFGRIFKNGKKPVPANLIAVRAPFHNLSMRQYFKTFGDMMNWMAMLAVSVVLIDRLVKKLRELTTGQRLVVGFSLGGFVTNLHRTYCNTADIYVPMLAGAALDDVFLQAAYRSLTGRLALDNPDIVTHQLDFEADFKRVKEPNVFPLLARFDQIIRYSKHSNTYEGHRIRSINRGHITGALDSTSMRRHVLWCLAKSRKPNLL